VIWESILQKANLIKEFDNIQIFFNGKGLKGAISASNFIDLSQQWSQLWSSNINDDYIDSDSYWLDLGRQITPSGNAEPMCLLWKECCLKHYHNVRTRPYGNVSSSPISYYRLAFLRDSSSVVIAPKKGGPEYAANLRYSQFYTKTKNNFVANAIEIFESPYIENLTYDKDEIRVTEHTARATTYTAREAAEQYIAGKERAYHHLKEPSDVGVREEHRGSGRCILGVVADLCVEELSRAGSIGM
jgi:hypothetical protein